MGSSILRGITMALLVTVLTLIAGIVWSVMELGVLSFSQLLDFGLMASCLVGGYRTAKVSGEWLLGGIVGAGYVTVGTLLLALFLPIRGWGFIQVLAEGAFIGLVGGAVGAGGTKGRRKSAWSGGKSIWSGNRTQVTPSYAGYEINDSVNTKFDWEKEEKSEENMDLPINNGFDSGERSPDVQWPWDREEDKTIISAGSGQSEPLEVWKKEPTQTEESKQTIILWSNRDSSIPWWEDPLHQRDSVSGKKE